METILQSRTFPVILCVLLLIAWYIVNNKEKDWKARERLGRYLLENPIAKTSLFVLTVILSGILCSAFVAELSTTQDGIKWSTFSDKLSFYWLIFIIVLDFIYNWFSNSYESEIMKYSDEKWLLSNMRKELFGTYMEHMKKQIKEEKVQPLDITKLFNV